ncbi:phosphate acyltransferase PlsX [Pedobacter sp. MR2016-19]|uniref:Phosphate acyltransferase n=1 Tax=Pedobacter alluvionis TaxID=475253 RepID=A0A497XU51_9SPHI|nr:MULTISPECIES: phosphate acyltransferase PlsX [Pedobacter]MBE5320137.1 phosphate acyltransferase PlsX [Pedobacter sp. MR2016-19]QXU41847.1 phosphate acyltransferase PlsX [Pedobacter sp. D749]RLJ71961.1 phosphate:acyl-[acyl carrier protein] acyltransferase [Pedobacter alluvionis]TFB28740.1 phosphate acyltransferase PlsX [Pedobacter alluvionis]
MKIGLDIMGGDYAPKAIVLGAIAAHQSLNAGEHLVLIGDTEQIKPILAEEGFNPDHFEYVHTDEVIGMGEHPTKAIVQKPNSSIAVGFNLLKEGKIDSFASAGNSGAMLVGAVFSVKTIPGIIRPCLCTILPKIKGGTGLLLDVGANADCKPDILLQFGVLGSLYAENLLQINDPKVALINIGEEDEKGNMLSMATFPLMKETSLFNFVGNVEGRDLFNDKADVIVCDGFTGNIMLKLAESFYVLTIKKGLKDEFFDRFNYEQYGGSPVLGVNAPVVIGHGISSPLAVKNMVLQSREMITTGLVEKIRMAFK